MGYKVSTNTQNYAENTTIRPDNFGGWLAVNIGSANVSVDGYPLAPGEGLDMTHLAPDVRWDKPIQIVITATGGMVRMTRLIYKQENRKGK